MQRISYSQASDYLAATQQRLAEKELEHNLILGISNAIVASGESNPNHVFVNIIKDEKILASSMKTTSRAIIANFSKDEFELFKLRNKEFTYEECAEQMNMCTRNVYRIAKRMKAKVMRVIY